MKIGSKRLHAFFSRCLYAFLQDGTTKAYGVIMESTVQAYQSKHALVGLIFTLQASVTYLVAPLVQLLENVLNPRIVAILGGLLVTLGFVGRAFVLYSSLWYLAMLTIVSGIGFGLVNLMTYLSLMDSFQEEFPCAFTVSSFASYIGVAALPPILGYFVITYGEQDGLLAFGVLSSLLILFGFFTSSKKDSPAATENLPLVGVDDITDEGEILMKESKECGLIPGSSVNYWSTLFSNHPEYICLLLISFMFAFQYITWSIYLVPYGESLGLTSTEAAYLSTSGGGAGITGRLFSLIIFRWEGTVIPAGVIVPTVLLGISYSISLLSADFIALILVAFLSGFCLSTIMCVTIAWLPNTVCPTHFEGAVSIRFCFTGVATILGGLVTGFVVDVTGSYRTAFAAMALFSLIGTIISIIWYLFIRKARL